MPYYIPSSKAKLTTGIPLIQVVFGFIIRVYDNTILWVKRGKEDQNQLRRDGRSKLWYPDSQHNTEPLSEAVDAAPWPLRWPTEPKTEQEKHLIKEWARFYHFGGYVQGYSAAMGEELGWGGDWNNNREFKDQKFDDLVHFFKRKPVR